jgi:hypothetical protein
VLGHALAKPESLDSLHIARSFVKTCYPWFLSPLNKALATAPFPSGWVGRSSGGPHFVLNTKGQASRRLTTKSNDLRAALVDEPKARLHGCATPLLKSLSSA